MLINRGANYCAPTPNLQAVFGITYIGLLGKQVRPVHLHPTLSSLSRKLRQNIRPIVTDDDRNVDLGIGNRLEEDLTL